MIPAERNRYPSMSLFGTRMTERRRMRLLTKDFQQLLRKERRSEILEPPCNYIWTHICIQIHVYLQMHKYMAMHTNMRECTHKHTEILAHIHNIHMYTYLNVCTYISTHTAHAHLYLYLLLAKLDPLQSVSLNHLVISIIVYNQEPL